MCSAIPFVTTMAIITNSFTLVGIALDRYIAVVKIVKTSYEPSGILCCVLTVVIWALAGGVFYSKHFFKYVIKNNVLQESLVQCGALTS